MLVSKLSFLYASYSNIKCLISFRSSLVFHKGSDNRSSIEDCLNMTGVDSRNSYLTLTELYRRRNVTVIHGILTRTLSRRVEPQCLFCLAFWITYGHNMHYCQKAIKRQIQQKWQYHKEQTRLPNLTKKHHTPPSETFGHFVTTWMKN